MKKTYKLLRGTVGDFVKKTVLVIFVTMLMGFAMSMMYKSSMGSDPISMLMQGCCNFFRQSFTVVNLAISIICIVVQLIVNPKRIYMGTIIAGTLVGVFCDFGNWALDTLLPGTVTNIFAQAAFCLGGFVLLGLAVGAYLPLEFGSSPTDGVVQILDEKIFHKFSFAMFAFYSLCFVLGLITGGSWGIGTLAGLFVPGLVAGWTMDFFAKGWPKWLRFDQR